MEKVVRGSEISFYDENQIEIMYMDYFNDEAIWCFNSSDIINITSDMELYEPIMSLMGQQYIFNDNENLKCYKNDSKLVWYSDCYYDADNDFSINSVSYLNTELDNNALKLWCIKPLDEVIPRKNKFHCISFSPLGNGRCVMNKNNGLTLQDDFVTMVYQKLLENQLVKRMKTNNKNV